MMWALGEWRRGEERRGDEKNKTKQPEFARGRVLHVTSAPQPSLIGNSLYFILILTRLWVLYLYQYHITTFSGLYIDKNQSK